MNCDQFRTIVGAEPDSARADLALHASSCTRCAAYRRELQEMDRAVFRALNVEVAASRHPLQRVRPRYFSWRAAAGLLLAVAATTSIWLAVPRESFAQQVVDHVLQEPKSLVRTLDRVPDAELAAVLSKSNVHLRPGAAQISYAMSCWFRGHFVPHLVVQTPDGPVTVLIMPHEAAVSRPETIAEEGFTGMVMPAPRGVLVVLGEPAGLEQVARAVLGALDYRS